MAETQEVRDKVVLVGLNSPVLKKRKNADEDTMEELSALVKPPEARPWDCAAEPAVPGLTFIGRARWRRGAALLREHRATMVIFDNDLSLPDAGADGADVRAGPVRIDPGHLRPAGQTMKAAQVSWPSTSICCPG